jgi:hypothetical protein
MMGSIYYWSPGSASGQTILGADDHYLRLGEYIAAQEPSEAGDGGQGIFFYTSGKYSLKSTGALHLAVDGPVVRTVETGDLTYTNADGDLSITATEGGIKVTAKESIHITSLQDGDGTTITVDAGDNDVYYQQGKYQKQVTTFESKTTRAHNHKTNIGVLVNTHVGVATTTSVTLELTYSSLSVGIAGAEIAFKGIALSWESTKRSLVPISTVSFTWIEGKTVFVDEEFCVFKNEFRWFRFTNGIGKFFEDVSCIEAMLEADMDENAIIAEFKSFDIVI